MPTEFPQATTDIFNDATDWRNLTIIGFDTETTGKYPLTAEICEIAAVKWKAGKVVDTYQTLLKPSRPMGAEVIGIHGITNEMVESAPLIGEKIEEFHDFIQGSLLVAHHAPFDLGFISIEIENAGLQLPRHPVLCSSLLARSLFPESANHRLQTLIQFFNIEQGIAHRALDDAKACLEVALRCLEKSISADGESLLSHALKAQGGALTWPRFAMTQLQNQGIAPILIRACTEEGVIDMVYQSGSKPGGVRRVQPLGLVRSLDGDFLVAYDQKDQRSKRYFLDKITSVERVLPGRI